MKSLRTLSRLNTGILLLVAALATPACTFAVAPATAEGAKFGGATPLELSQRMARSEMARQGDKLIYPNPAARWDYTRGFLARSLMLLGQRLDDAPMADYGAKIAESFVTPEGGIATYKLQDYNLDMLPPGRALLLRYEQTRDERLKKAVELLRRQLAEQPRTSDGGFWHKQRYPYQMWLDGLFMGSTFYAQYGKVFSEGEAFDDVAKQIVLMDKHAYDPKTGLHYHAWDEKRQQSWANKETGTSPNFWGRAEGWYAMALVDCLDYIPPTQSDVEKVNDIFRRVADGIVRWQDPQTGLWWQVLDQGSREGNYREATASCMFVYALAKGINRGYLARDQYLPAVKKGYAGIVRDLLRTGDDGRLNLVQCCSVAGLGFTSSKGRPRDGTFEYYISEPIVENDLKGVPAFILAGIEIDKGVGSLLPERPEGYYAQKTPDPFVPARGWTDAEAILARIKAPVFPDRDFPITEYGAVAGGADCTEAVAKAISAANAAGGGRVVVPAGEWHSGAIRLKSNVNLHVAEGATLKFSTDPAKYPTVFTRWEGVECMNYSPLIYAWEQENVAVTGKGTLDGSASLDNWWGWCRKGGDKPARQNADRKRLNEMGQNGVPVAQRVFGEGSFLRPNFIQPYRCRNVLVEGITILNSPMWEIHPALCTNVTVRGVKINTHGPNNDGCDPECCRDVLIEDCVFDTGDDCIAIKSGRNNDGRRVGVPSENFVIRNCTMKDGHGGVVVGSEISGGCRNVFAENCTMDSPNLDRALRLKTNASRGGTIESIFMRKVTVGHVGEAVLTIDLLYEEGPKGDFPPTVRNISIEQVTSSASPRVMYIRGFPGATIDGIKFTDCTFKGITTTEVLEGAGTVTLKNVTIEPAKKSRGLNSRPASDSAQPQDQTPAPASALN
jgi:unsaturated rhamnogalacturonyl hydrolase